MIRLLLFIAGAAFAVYYFRRYWLTPWGIYVSHTETKSGGVFMTVRHVRWYPPFLNFERVYHRDGGFRWVEEGTGYEPPNGGELARNHQSKLEAMIRTARARQSETEEMLRPTGAVKK